MSLLVGGTADLAQARQRRQPKQAPAPRAAQDHTDRMLGLCEGLGKNAYDLVVYRNQGGSLSAYLAHIRQNLRQPTLPPDMEAVMADMHRSMALYIFGNLAVSGPVARAQVENSCLAGAFSDDDTHDSGFPAQKRQY